MREVFDAARALPQEARSAYLANTCGDDDGLRREVEALLDSHQRAAGFLEQPAHYAPTPEPVTTHLEGQRIGPYQVHARIGAGGMGEVYRARDTRLDRTVAIKVLPAHVAMDPATRERFDREARAVAALNHPHICTLHDVGEAPSPDPAVLGAQSIRFFVMEFVEGATLDALGDLPMDTERAVAIAAQVCDALDAAHAKGIVHRDIKPQNIMVSPRGHVKVLDFGIARLDPRTPDESTALHTKTGLVMGTLPYMSPEQLCGDTVTGSSDVFSLGVVLYQLVTGRHPFAVEGHAPMQALARAVLVGAPTPARLLNPAISASLETLILRMLENDPAQRPSATEARQRLTTPSPTTGATGVRRSTSNLPLHIAPFIGREDDVTGVRGALMQSRLVTLTGAGGVGKTRLALQVAAAIVDTFADGAWLVDLSPVSDPGHVAIAVADILGVRERPDRPIADTVCDHLRQKTLLIVLDNCEHLIEASARLAQQLLASCATITVLATSRETLGVPGETAWRLRSLNVPEPGGADLAAVARTESVQLFLQRARAARSGFELTAENAGPVVQICRRLDGLPLAIELAAARVSAMAIVEIAERLDDRFRLLTGGARSAVPRQRTLEATVSWSYELLTEPERLLFARLAVFSGGWTLDAAERVCGDEPLVRGDIADRLAHLVERSMAAADETAEGRTRYRLLETLRQFGRDRLVASGTMIAQRDRHLAWAVALAETVSPRRGQIPPDVAAEADNLRVALEWAYETGSYESGLRIMSRASLGHFGEQTRMLKLLLPFADRAPLDVRGQVAFTAGGLAFMIGDWRWGVDILRESAEINAAAGDAMRRSMSLTYLGACHWGLGDSAAALEAIEHGLADARATRDGDALARALLLRTWFETGRDLAQAEALAIDAERAAAALATPFDAGHSREVRAFVHCLKGEIRRGTEALADAVAMFKNIQINCGSHVLETAAAWAAMTGRFELGAEFMGAAHRIREDTGDKPRPWERAVQEMWLPKIAAALDPQVYEAAHRRGTRRPFAKALDFAERELRATIREGGDA